LVSVVIHAVAVVAGYFVAYSVVMLLNLIGAVTYFSGCIHFKLSTENSGVTFGLSIVYFVLFIPCSFICWYRPLYKAFRFDSVTVAVSNRLFQSVGKSIYIA